MTCEWDYDGGRPAGQATAADKHHRHTATMLCNYCAYLAALGMAMGRVWVLQNPPIMRPVAFIYTYTYNI